MTKTGNVLIIDDDADVLNAARLLLKQYVEKVDVEKNPRYLPELLESNEYDLLLLDMNFTGDFSSGREGFKWMGEVKKIDPALSVILITAYGDVEKAVKAMRYGAADFVLKPWQNEKLIATVKNAINLTRGNRQINTLQAQKMQLGSQLDQHYQSMIGRSDAMQRVFKTIEKVAATDASILILGENGTGKELVARALHRRSARKEDVFITVDMGAIPENLHESELFGHIKGAFTGAVQDKTGRFEIASGGTLFLDEIGNTPLTLQSKILSALESRQIIRVGSTSPKKIDVRLISATNSDIHQMVSEGEFRQDLLYRINTIEIKIPPLRDRVEDIPLLASHFLKEYVLKYNKEISGISGHALSKLKNYAWPGNVREFQHAMERAVILAESKQLESDDFLLEKENQESIKKPENMKLDELERFAVQKALKNNEGNITKAAEELGLTRASLYRRMEKYGL
ncbi:MAG: sigma-54-dependent transcriptional regulator [Balneolaceae bacterium]